MLSVTDLLKLISSWSAILKALNWSREPRQKKRGSSRSSPKPFPGMTLEIFSVAFLNLMAILINVSVNAICKKKYLNLLKLALPSVYKSLFTFLGISQA